MRPAGLALAAALAFASPPGGLWPSAALAAQASERPAWLEPAERGSGLLLNGDLAGAALVLGQAREAALADDADAAGRDARYWAVLDNLGQLALWRQRPAEALELFEDSLELAREHRPQDGVDVAEALGRLAVALEALGQREAAMAALDEALAIQTRRMGADHPSVAATRHQAARLALDLGDLGRASDDANRAFTVRTARLGGAHPKTLASAALLARTQAAAGESEAALQRLREAARRGEEAGAPALALAEVVLPLARLEAQAGRGKAAREAIENLAERLDEDDAGAPDGTPRAVAAARFLNAAGVVLAEAGFTEQARTWLQRAAGAAERDLGGGAAAVAPNLNLAEVLLRLGEHEAAAGPIEAAEAALEREFGADDPGLAPVLEVKASLAMQQGRYREAAVALERAYALRRAGNLGPPAALALNLEAYARMLDVLARRDEAAAVRADLERMRAGADVSLQAVEPAAGGN